MSRCRGRDAETRAPRLPSDPGRAALVNYRAEKKTKKHIFCGCRGTTGRPTVVGCRITSARRGGPVTYTDGGEETRGYLFINVGSFGDGVTRFVIIITAFGGEE